MKEDYNYLKINKESWNKRTEVHYDSAFYDNKSFLEGRSSLNSIELDLLGDIKGKSVLHLQCHFGQDTLSLSKLGADVTGVDFSEVAIEKAQQLASEMNSKAKFIIADIYSLPEILDQKFDIVFTSYGTIGWLPDINKWASVVSHFLKPGGLFVFVEFHPVVWMFDDDFKEVKYKYFNSTPIIENSEGTYTDGGDAIKQDYVSWNHGIGEVVSALINNGLTINALNEFDYSPYDCFSKTIEVKVNKFRIKHLKDYIPMVYSISAAKND